MKNKKVCSICGKKYEGFGNNASPINSGRCCNECNSDIVIPMRLLTIPIWIAKDNNTGEITQMKSHNGLSFDYYKNKGILTDCSKIYLRNIKEEDVNNAVDMLGTLYEHYEYRFGDFKALQEDYEYFMENAKYWSID